MSKKKKKVRKKKKAGPAKHDASKFLSELMIDGFRVTDLLPPVRPRSEQEKLDWFAGVSPYEPMLLPDDNCHMPARQCFVNVNAYAAEHKLTPIVGWIVWDSHYLEMESHAVCWDEQNDTYVDVTKRVDGEKEVLFIRDDSITVAIHGATMTAYRNLHFPSTAKKTYERTVNAVAKLCLSNPKG